MRAFAVGEYRNALAQGGGLASAEYDRGVAMLPRYTSLSESYIRNANRRFALFGSVPWKPRKDAGRVRWPVLPYTIDRESPNPNLEVNVAAIDATYIGRATPHKLASDARNERQRLSIVGGLSE
ncbi:MAG: hypothetical protein WA304_08345 [Candidatus Cybelea sp.]